MRQLFLGALKLEPIPFIGDGSHSWQGCQLESYAMVKTNNDTTLPLDIYIYSVNYPRVTMKTLKCNKLTTKGGSHYSHSISCTINVLRFFNYIKMQFWYKIIFIGLYLLLHDAQQRFLERVIRIENNFIHDQHV